MVDRADAPSLLLADRALGTTSAPDRRRVDAGSAARAPVPRPCWRGKRWFDVGGALVLLVLVAPLLLLAALAVRCSSSGPVLFRQERVGRGGRPFLILKFRSMTVDAEERLGSDAELQNLYVQNDYKVPSRLDPRTTPVGRLLRRLSLDELPQLFNVLAGSMSLVGPRPICADQLGSYGQLVGAYIDLRPGLTGIWQVAGRSAVTFPERAALDMTYTRLGSPILDVAILLKTPLAVLRSAGTG